MLRQQVVSPPTTAVIANVNCVVPAKDGCSNDKSLEGVVTSYKERLCILTYALDALKKKLTLEQERRRDVESEFTNTKKYVEKLLVEGRKSNSLMV